MSLCAPTQAHTSSTSTLPSPRTCRPAYQLMFGAKKVELKGDHRLVMCRQLTRQAGLVFMYLLCRVTTGEDRADLILGHVLCFPFCYASRGHYCGDCERPVRGSGKKDEGDKKLSVRVTTCAGGHVVIWPGTLDQCSFHPSPVLSLALQSYASCPSRLVFWVVFLHHCSRFLLDHSSEVRHMLRK